MKFQRGGFVLGLVVGLLVGLGLALGVALYVTKAPVPFVNKVPQRSAEQDAREAQKNRNWDPNAPLAGKAASGVVTAGPAPAASATTPAAAPAPAPAGASAPPPSKRDPAAILAGAGPAASKAPGAEPYIFFVQAGAFQRVDEAEAQRAKLALLGLESRLVEREQSGRTVYRVRVGPLEKQTEAETLRDKLNAGGIESVLVRAERPAQ